MLRRTSICIFLLLWFGAAPLFALDQPGDRAEFERIIDQHCINCHTRDRIDEAIRKGDNIEAILEKMLRFGARLSERDQQVLGTFWGEPLKK